jgi:hypothetical protein
MLGGVLTIAFAGAFLGRDNPVRRYAGAAAPTAPPAQDDASLDTGPSIGNTIAPS